MNRRAFFTIVGLAMASLLMPAIAAPQLPGKLVIVENIGEYRALCTVDPNTGEVKRIFTQDRQEDGPCVSPDGNTLLFAALSGSSGWQTWAYDFATAKARLLIAKDSWPTLWLPDGRFIGNLSLDLCLFDATGRKLKTISAGEAMPTTGDITPDGTFIYGDGHEPVQLQAVDLRTFKRRKLGLGHSPVVMPDGRTFIFVNEQAHFTMPIAGGKRIAVRALPKNAMNLHSSPDGQYMVWSTDTAKGGTSIVIATPSFQPIKTILINQPINSMTWGR